MREIMFRGFSKAQNKMVFGDLMKDGSKWFIANLEGATRNYYDIVIVSVGQFTGLKDKNGVDIYDGDICLKYWSEEVYGKRDPAKGVVKWVSFGGRYTIEWIDEVGNKRYEELHENLKYPEYPRSLIEVIGNIYQNPELLNTSAS